MSAATPSVHKTQFDSLFRYKKGSSIPLPVIERELYLDGKYKTYPDLERYLRHNNIIHNPSFVENSGVLSLKDYEYINPNNSRVSKVPRLEESSLKSSDEPRSKRKSSRKKSSDDESVFSFVSQSDVESIRRDINSINSEFQNHGDRMYEITKKQEDYLRRMESVCNSQDHLEWLDGINLDELPITHRKILLKKLLGSNLNTLLRDLSECLTEEDGRKHNILLVVDGLKNEKLENRSIWSNSNRGNYEFKLYDEFPLFGFIKGETVTDKTKHECEIKKHFRK